MNGAEFKTHHEALGVSTELIADHIGCHVNNVWQWERRAGNLPERAADGMWDLVARRDAAADRLAAELRDWGTITRYTNPADFDAAVPEMAGWGERAQGLLLAEVQRRIQAPIVYAPVAS